MNLFSGKGIITQKGWLLLHFSSVSLYFLPSVAWPAADQQSPPAPMASQCPFQYPPRFITTNAWNRTFWNPAIRALLGQFCPHSLHLFTPFLGLWLCTSIYIAQCLVPFIWRGVSAIITDYSFIAFLNTCIRISQSSPWGPQAVHVFAAFQLLPGKNVHWGSLRTELGNTDLL